MVAQFRDREVDRETEVQTNFLHLFGDFSQSAVSRHMSGNSVDMSKRYFQNCTGSSNPSPCQQVIDITEIILLQSICATFPAVSGAHCANSKLRERSTPYSSD